MKRRLLATVSVGTLAVALGGTLSVMPISKALAQQATGQGTDDLSTLKKDIAKLRAENAALRERDQLLQENMKLRERAGIDRQALGPGQQVPANPTPTARAPQQSSAVALSSPLAVDPKTGTPLILMDYAGGGPSDQFFKAPVASPRKLDIWAEGGAYWTGGDPVDAPWGILNDFSLTPKLGWDGAAGFDYRFGGSPWHISGEFRYGQAKTSANGSSTSAFSVLGAGAGLVVGYAVSLTQSAQASEREPYWLADFAVGRDVFGSDPDALQVKLGIRIADLKSQTNITSTASEGALEILAGGGTGAAIIGVANNQSTIEQNSTFLGIGPRVGVDGAIPIRGAWSLDYLGDVALLEGQQNFSAMTTSKTTALVLAGEPGFILLGGFAATATFGTGASQMATVLNADVQAGLSYHVSPNVKVTASYRLDAFSDPLLTMNPSASVSNLTKIGRYDQGPLLGLTGTW